MSLAAYELQKAVFSALSGDTALVAALGGVKIHDLAPAKTTYPYITFGPASAHDWSTGTEAGSEHFFTLNVWAGRTGKGEALALMERVEAALHEAALALDGHQLVNLRRESSDILFEEDLSIHRGRVRFRAVVEPL